MFHNGDSIKTLEKEIKKCDVLCANCHKREHASDVRRQVIDELSSGTLVEYKRIRRSK
ncbi:Uncharacterised protein [uncultured archaeon]|nr:Uncharacterised protein [uncultured archaeon]